LNSGKVTEVSSSGLSGGFWANRMMRLTAAMAIAASRSKRTVPEMPAELCLVTLL
jgi:hypothetical protein